MSNEIVVLSTGLDRSLETISARIARGDTIDDLEMEILKQRANAENLPDGFVGERIEYWKSITEQVDKSKNVS
jgi:hypothetical protein